MMEASLAGGVERVVVAVVGERCAEGSSDYNGG